MPPIEQHSELEQKTQARAEILLQESVLAVNIRTDRLFAGLLLFQWVVGIIIASTLSPQTWSGTIGQTHPHVWLAVLMGASIIAYPLLLIWARSGTPLTRHAVAVAQMLTSSLLIHLTGGRIETHFHIFGSLAFLAFYRDWRVLITASAVTASDHFLRGTFLPLSIYGSQMPGAWRWLEHTGYVIFENIFLMISIVQSRREIHSIAMRQAQLEFTNEMVEAKVIERTTELQVASERFRLATESGELGVWVYDIVNDILTWDERMMTLYGFTSETFHGAYESWSERLHPDDKARTEADLWEAIKGGRKYQPEFRIVLPDGVTRYIKADAVVLENQSNTPTQMVGLNQDITERKLADEALKHAQARLEEAQQVARLGSWEFDVATREIFWSKEMFHLLKFDPAEGAPSYEQLTARFHPDDVPMHNAMVKNAVENGQSYAFDIRVCYSVGREGWAHAIGNVVRDDRGQVTRLFGTLMDITERKQAQQQLEEANYRLSTLASTDGLTGLHNHRTFQEKLAEEFERTQRYKIPLSVLLLDVDKFKTYNDAFGHPEGDVVLKTVAKVLQSVTRDTDYACRYGGEEFVIILPNTDAPGATEAAERFRVAIEKQLWTLRPITASFGVSTQQADLTTVQELITQADKAMYVSKKKGRNRVTHFADISLRDELGDPVSALIDEPDALAA